MPVENYKDSDYYYLIMREH